MSLTKENLKRFTMKKDLQDEIQKRGEGILDIDDRTRNFLQTNLNIDVKSLNNFNGTVTRPMSATNGAGTASNY